MLRYGRNRFTRIRCGVDIVVVVFVVPFVGIILRDLLSILYNY